MLKSTCVCLMGVFIIEYYHNFIGLPPKVSSSYIPRSNSPLTIFLDNNTVRQNYILTRSIFADRAKLIEKIPHFWAIVFDEATEEIDRFIQPCDTDALNTLQTLHVSRFDISFDTPGVGEPRSVRLTFTFGENSWFEDRVLEKTFWYRLSRTGYTGLVSEPVRIRWKEGKDLTEGLLDESCRLFEIETDIKKFERHPEPGHDTTQKLNELKALRHALVEKLEHRLKGTQQDAISFFAWFGYRGRNVSAEESAGVVQTEIQRRKHRKSRNENGSADNVMIDDHEAESAASKVPLVIDTSELDHEIFPAGEELAVAISDDLYPGAIKYFSQLFTS